MRELNDAELMRESRISCTRTACDVMIIINRALNNRMQSRQVLLRGCRLHPKNA